MELRTTKVRGLLGVLAFKNNETVSAEYLTHALWDDESPGRSSTLQVHVSRLRRLLNESACPAVVHTEQDGYRLEIDPSDVDYQRFVNALSTGRRALGRGEHAVAADHFAEAVDLWRGPFIADLRTAWARRQRAALVVRDLLPAHSALFEAKLALGESEFVLERLPALLSDHPYDETLAGQWMRVLADTGRSSEIPAFFRDFSQRLNADLGVAPSPNLVQITEETARGGRTGSRPVFAVRVPPLPRDTPHFTGRTELLARLDALLSGPEAAGRVVALDGRPGVGKTALIRYWARRRQGLFPDGILHLDLAGYADVNPVEPSAAMGVFLDELGVPAERIPNAVDERAAMLRDTLAGRRVLVILDNVRDSAHARPMLAATAGCPVVLTSRKRLTGSALRDGAERITVPELRQEEATALVVARSGRRAMTEPDAIDELVDLCERLPLAVRVVAEHVAARTEVPLRELVDELRHTRRLLDAGAQGDDDTVTLRSALSWSYRALRPVDRRVFRMLGLLPNTRFSAAAVAAVGGLDRFEVDQPLDALVGAHLIEQEGAGRYRAHDICREYAADRVQRDESPESRAEAVRRMLTWYVEAARAARSFLIADPHQVPALPSPEPVTPPSFTTKEEAKQWFDLERASLVGLCHRAAKEGHDEAAWRLAACLNVLSGRGDLHELLEVQNLGRAAAARAGRPDAEAGCLTAAGVLHAALRDHQRAAQCFEEAYHAFRAAGDSYGESIAMHNIGSIRLRLGRPAEAIDWHRRALAAFTASHDEWMIGITNRWLGDDHLALGEHAEAHRHYLKSRHLSRKLGDLEGEGRTLNRVARLNLDIGRLDLAVSTGEDALVIHERTGDRASAAEVLCTLATARTELGAYPTAIAHATEAAATHQGMRNTAGWAQALEVLGNAYAAADDHDQARASWLTAADLLDSLGDSRAGDLRARAEQPAVPKPRPERPGVPDERAVR
ncbi:BTAD domain-containing putative transcriptional regulator [Actinophytocola sp.]|uniref:AfsR/SARP family transcriptional regulator n=1 Tax=Actinophytocola sp. TaxID=1872138 RepID=UPI00389A6589